MNKYSTLFSRFLAACLDGIIFTPIICADLYINFPDKYVYILWMIISLLARLAYSTYFHGTSGQTIGKKTFGVKVVDISEQTIIGFKRAFLRDILNVMVEIIPVIYFVHLTWQTNVVSEGDIIHYEDALVYLGLIVTAIECIVVIMNSKRRALHDFIAGSVVIHIIE